MTGQQMCQVIRLCQTKLSNLWRSHCPCRSRHCTRAGLFVKRTHQGRDYWYFRSATVAGNRNDKYVRPASPELSQRIARHRTEKAGYKERWTLVSALIRSGLRAGCPHRPHSRSHGKGRCVSPSRGGGRDARLSDLSRPDRRQAQPYECKDPRIWTWLSSRGFPSRSRIRWIFRFSTSCAVSTPISRRCPRFSHRTEPAASRSATVTA